VQTRLAFLGHFLARFAAGLGFAVEGLRDGRGTAHLAESKHFNFKDAAVGGDGEQVADAHLARGAGGLMPGLDAAQLAGAAGEGARFEEARSPEPFVEASPFHRVQGTGDREQRTGDR